MGSVFESDVDFDGVQQTVESDPNAFIAGGFENFLGPLDLRVDYFTTDRYYTVGIFPQLQSSSLMVSGLFTAEVVPGRVDLYGGAGVGMVDVDFNGAFGFQDGVSGGDTVFGWQALGGARVKLFDWPLSAFAEYRYQTAGDVDMPGGHTAEYNSTSLMGGFRWNF